MKGIAMTNIVLLGGNGYLGRNVTRKWLEKDPQATFYVVSRSGKNTLEDSRIINIQADVTDYDDVISKLPDTIDRIADFVGRPESDPEKFRKVNDEPAEVMLAIARNKKYRQWNSSAGLRALSSLSGARHAWPGCLKTAGSQQ